MSAKATTKNLGYLSRKALTAFEIVNRVNHVNQIEHIRWYLRSIHRAKHLDHWYNCSKRTSTIRCMKPMDRDQNICMEPGPKLHIFANDHLQSSRIE